MNVNVDVKELFHLSKLKLLNWSGVPIDKLTVLKKILYFVEPEIVLPRSQMSTTSPYTESDESNPQPPTPFLSIES
jgi:hypothetical protein